MFNGIYVQIEDIKNALTQELSNLSTEVIALKRDLKKLEKTRVSMLELALDTLETETTINTYNSILEENMLRITKAKKLINKMEQFLSVISSENKEEGQ